MVHGGDYGSEGLPVYVGVDPGEPVAVLLDVFVGFSEHVGSECSHVCLLGMVIYKFNRGGLEAVKTEVNQNSLKCTVSIWVSGRLAFTGNSSPHTMSSFSG